MKRMPRTRAALAAAALLATAAAQAQNYRLEGAVIDSRDSRNLGVVSESGSIDSLFRAQKTMTFGILRAAGISLEQLSPEVRARIERFATTNLEAFRAFSQGLDLKDQGRFAEAREAFRRAAELDPSFTLAQEQQRAMPDVNAIGGVQLRAALAAAATTAVDKGKAVIAVDTGRALAALSQGATLLRVTAEISADPTQNLSRDSGAAGEFKPNIVAGYAFSLPLGTGDRVTVADVAEWRGDRHQLSGGTLLSLGAAGSEVARRASASDGTGGSVALQDGSLAYWGAWLSAPGASAEVQSNGQTLRAPELQRFDYVHGQATRVMPSAGSFSFTPVATAGSLQNTTGSIRVDFVQRTVALQNLGFNLGALGFSGLTGTATYDNTTPGVGSASGAFRGSYTAGSCNGCVRFDATASTFGGSFIGRNADGLVFSTLLATGAAPVGGVQLFVKP